MASCVSPSLWRLAASSDSSDSRDAAIWSTSAPAALASSTSLVRLLRRSSVSVRSLRLSLSIRSRSFSRASLSASVSRIPASFCRCEFRMSGRVERASRRGGISCCTSFRRPRLASSNDASNSRDAASLSASSPAALACSTSLVRLSRRSWAAACSRRLSFSSPVRSFSKREASTSAFLMEAWFSRWASAFCLPCSR